MLRLVALLLPLSLDTFVVGAALGAAGIPPSKRLHVSLVFTVFEAAMPLVGIALGQAFGHALGSRADYLAAATLLALGAYLLLNSDEDESEAAAKLARAHGLAVLALGLSISLDELAIGFSVGLLRLPFTWAIVLIACQAFLAAQLGLRLGAHVGEHVQEQAERVAGLTLIALGFLLLSARIG